MIYHFIFVSQISSGSHAFQIGRSPDQTSLGLVGFQIGRVFDQMRSRPDAFRIRCVPDQTRSGLDYESPQNKEVFWIVHLEPQKL